MAIHAWFDASVSAVNAMNTYAMSIISGTSQRAMPVHSLPAPAAEPDLGAGDVVDDLGWAIVLRAERRDVFSGHHTLRRCFATRIAISSACS